MLGVKAAVGGAEPNPACQKLLIQTPLDRSNLVYHNPYKHPSLDCEKLKGLQWNYRTEVIVLPMTDQDFELINPMFEDNKSSSMK